MQDNVGVGMAKQGKGWVDKTRHGPGKQGNESDRKIKQGKARPGRKG